MSYWKTFYHMIWSTCRREPLISLSVEAVLIERLKAKARELRVYIHAVGTVPDHMHLVVSIPPVISVAECVRQLKGFSSFWINKAGFEFRWQDGYGVLTIGERSLEQVTAYVRNQKEHHAGGSIMDLYERENAQVR